MRAFILCPCSLRVKLTWQSCVLRVSYTFCVWKFKDRWSPSKSRYPKAVCINQRLCAAVSHVQTAPSPSWIQCCLKPARSQAFLEWSMELGGLGVVVGEMRQVCSVSFQPSLISGPALLHCFLISSPPCCRVKWLHFLGQPYMANSGLCSQQNPGKICDRWG